MTPRFPPCIHTLSFGIFTFNQGDPHLHLIMDSFQRRLVQNALALARATKRKLIFPKLQCYTDRYWNMLEGGRFPGVRPSAQPLPFHCPFDHLYDLDKWVHLDVPMREFSFLDNPRVSAADRNDAVRVRVAGADEPTLGNESRAIVLNPGDDYAAAAAALRARRWDEAYVVKVGARSLELLCETLGDTSENAKFNQIMHQVLGVGEQIRYCDLGKNPTWANRVDDAKNPINCTWGFHRPPPLPESGSMFSRAADGAKCLSDVSKIREERLKEPEREWRKANIRESWSTKDRPGYLYRQYM